MYEQDAITEARNRRLFALVGGGLALLIVLVGLIMMLSVSRAKAAAGAVSPGPAVVVTHVVS